MALFRHTAAVTLDVPFRECPHEGCKKRLVEKPPVNGILLTISHGKLPVMCPSVYCSGEIFHHTVSLRLKRDGSL